jgi:hypothetical protein
MATFYGNGYGAALGKGASAGSAPALSAPELLGGKNRVLSFKYTVLATEILADVILLGRIPKGARIWKVYFGSEDLSTVATTVLTLQMGATAISAGFDVSSAVAAAVDLTAITGLALGQGVLVTAGNEEIKAVVSGVDAALDAAAGRAFWGLILYSVE